jgi:carbon monoxide dehydrogenase subunit G
MDLSGQIRTTCPPDQLVRVMRDPAALAQLLPFGSKMDSTGEGTYAFSVSKSVGPIKLTLPGTMALTATGSGHDQTLSAHAAHLIGGKVDLTLALSITTEGRVTHMAYQGNLTASGLAGRVLAEHKSRANGSLKAALLRLKAHAEGEMLKDAKRPA